MIETLPDWNTRLGYCACCHIPDCGTLEMLTEIKTGTASTSGFAPFVEPAGLPEDDLPKIYRASDSEPKTDVEGTAVRKRYGGNSSFTFENLQTDTYAPGVAGAVITGIRNAQDRFSADCSAADFPPTVVLIPTTFVAVELPPPECEETTKKYWTGKSEFKTGGAAPSLDGCPGPFTGAAEIWADLEKDNYRIITLSDPITKAELRTEAEDEMTADDWGGSGNATYTDGWPSIGDVGEWPDCPATNAEVDAPAASITLTKSRFRFQIPSSHEGSYYKITYDIAEFPDDPELDDSFVSEDLTVEWTGPGDQADQEDASWFTPWVEIDPPEVPGQRRVVNIRYICYHGTKYGSKPQVTGEAFELPEPPPP